jgi:DNA polymerase-1
LFKSCPIFKGRKIITFGTIENIYKELEKGNGEKFKKVGITDRIINLLKEGKEEAEFSKMLATIRRDAPIDFVLPKPFKESIDLDKLANIFNDLDFRNMLVKLESSLDIEVDLNNKEKEEQINIDALELKKTFIALWLLNSNLTDPNLEDVFSFAKIRDFVKAKQIIFPHSGIFRIKKQKSYNFTS